MNNKIDFIIHSKEKAKGVGINRLETEFKEKSIGIQFTINKNVISHKTDQILKAKERGVKVDDIIYVDLDGRILQKAIIEWEKVEKPIAGPWKFLPPEIKKGVLENLLGEVLTEEQKNSLKKITEKK